MYFSAKSDATQNWSGWLDARNLDGDILARIQHLDLSNNITDRSREAVAYGRYSEAFTGLLHRGENEPLRVAIERLRFHVDEEKVKKVRPLLLFSK